MNKRRLPHIDGEYNRRKTNIIYMLEYYSRNLTEDPRLIGLGTEDLEYMQQLDENMFIVYNQQLLLLEAQYILGIVE